MSYETIIFERVAEGIVKITLNRPHVLNAINDVLRRELIQALRDIQGDESVAVVILSGAGRAFCAGQDLKSPGDLFFETASAQRDNYPQHLIPGLRVPVIAAVNGFAITAGLEVALACDIVIASESALFRDTHAQMGLLPAGGNTQRLPRLVGEKKAKEILFASEFFSAKEAEKMGMVNKSVPPERLEEEVMLLARKIASQPRDMIRQLKRVVNEGMGMDLSAAMEYEWQAFLASRVNRTPEDIRQRGYAVIKDGHGQAEQR